MYYYGGCQSGYGCSNPCSQQSCGGFGSGAAIILVLFILLVIILSARTIVQ